MAKVVEVWRLEHINCPNLPGTIFTNGGVLPPNLHHGPHVWVNSGGNSSCISSARPNFGAVGGPPWRISPDHFCGVTRRQLPNWWGNTREEFMQKRKLWRNAGWAFAIYKMPKTRVRWDNGQIVFNPRNAESRRVVSWLAVPAPTHA